MAQNVTFCLHEGYSRKIETILVPVSNFYFQEINFILRDSYLVCVPKYLERVRRGRLLLVSVLPGLTSTVSMLPCVSFENLYFPSSSVSFKLICITDSFKERIPVFKANLTSPCETKG